MTDYSGELLAACCGTALHLWRPKIGSDGEDKAVPSDRTVLAAAWNRNNKVVASAKEDGSIELRYSNGTLMTTLPRGGPPPGFRPATSLAWSMGSKRLAAASLDGNVYLHDMTAKTCTPLVVEPSSPLTSVAYHPDDRFLAAAGLKISLFSVSSLNPLGNLSLETETPGFSSIAVAASQPMLAAGTSCGCVAVWDYKTKKQLYIDTSRHIGGTTAVQFAPLDPNVLYSTGKDGALLMQDLRDGPFHVPTARIGAGTGLTTLSIREDFTYLAAGTVDGRVLLYDPRYCSAPAATLHCGDPAPVTSIHWQHNYQSLSSRAKDAVANAVTQGTLPSGRLSMAMSIQGGEGEEGSSGDAFPAAVAGTVSDRFASAYTPSGSATVGGGAHHKGNRLSMASSLASHLEPPRRLDPMSPVVSVQGAGEAGGSTIVVGNGDIGERKIQKGAAPGGAAPTTSISEYHAALSRLRRESTATTVNAPPPPRQQQQQDRPIPATTTTTAAAAVVSKNAELPSQGTTLAESATHNTIQQRVLTSPLPPLSPLSPLASTGVEAAGAAAATPSGSNGEPSWRIKAMTPRRGAAAAGGGGGDRDTADTHAWVSSRRQFETTSHPAAGSPSKIPLSAVPPAVKEQYQQQPSSQTPQLKSATLIDGHALQQDILAMHLDMLTHFKEQEKANAALVAGVVAKQHALEEEVAALRQEVRDLLSRRDNTLWL